MANRYNPYQPYIPYTPYGSISSPAQVAGWGNTQGAHGIELSYKPISSVSSARNYGGQYQGVKKSGGNPLAGKLGITVRRLVKEMGFANCNDLQMRCKSSSEEGYSCLFCGSGFVKWSECVAHLDQQHHP